MLLDPEPGQPGRSIQWSRVRREHKMQLADAARGYRAELDQLLAEVMERDEPPTSLETRLMVELASARLTEIEGALRGSMYGARGGVAGLMARLRRIKARVRSWTRPRVGVLRHYEPKPLAVPSSYTRSTPPDPAPSISIVTPSYQQGRFLARTLYSVVSQNYPGLEYVVHDGGSSDETIDVLRRFEPMLTGWTSEPDSGQADAINRAFRRTSGEIMAWLNSDDLLLPGTLAYVAHYFADHPKVDVVYGHRLLIDENDGQVGAWVMPRHDDLTLTFADYIPQETLFWRRRIWDAAGGHADPSFRYALDWDLLLRFREVGATMVRLPRFLGAFRIHDEQKTTASDAIGAAECELLRQRVHGRPVPRAEVLERLRPFFVRHILAHTRQRIVDRLPSHMIDVRTVPIEPWLNATSVGHEGEELDSENGQVRLRSATSPRAPSR